MARHPRLDLVDVPQHIVQRGNNRSACFYDDRQRLFYLDVMRTAASAARVSVHAYVLMGNHVHLLVTPHQPGAVSTLMQTLGRRYVQWINKLCNRTGTLFEGRFKSSLVQSKRYLLACYRYIELNPVRAGLARHAADYRWSSYRCNALGAPDGLITPHSVFADLGLTAEERRDRYQAFVAQGLPPDEYNAIRSHVRQGRALGSTAFQKWVESATGRRAKLMSRGRPRKK